jgi:voltage-gated sodium channel
MVIGIVVNVMEEEHALMRQEKEPSMTELQNEIRELKSLLMTNNLNTKVQDK